MTAWNEPTKSLGEVFLKMAQKHTRRMSNSRMYFCYVEDKDTLHNIAESGDYEVFTCMTPGCYHSKATRTR